MTGFDLFKQGTTEPVAADGKEMGELALRGNMVMKGYLKSRKATEEAFADGWFRTGDLGSNILMAISKLWIGSKTSSSQVAKTSQVSKSKTSYIKCQRSKTVLSLPHRMINGAKCRSHLSRFMLAVPAA